MAADLKLNRVLIASLSVLAVAISVQFVIDIGAYLHDAYCVAGGH